MCQNKILDSYNEFIPAYKETSDLKMLNYQWLSNDVSITEFENNVKIYVNRKSSEVQINDISIPAESFKIIKE